MEKINLTSEGANTLREFSAIIQQTMIVLEEETDGLYNVFLANQEYYGIMSDMIESLVLIIKSMQNEVREAIEVLPKRLNEVANMMDDFIASTYNV